MNATHELRRAVASLACAFLLASCGGPFGPPRGRVVASDLAGTWVAHYAAGTVDTLVLNDGTFKQTYRDTTQSYHFETPWSRWELESLPNGLTRIHLHGARYYLEGIERAEKNGRQDPKNPCLTPTDCSWGLEPFEFYDPYSQELVQMVDELTLEVRADASGALLLHQVWTSSDEGFAIIGGDREIFRRSWSP